MSTHMDQQYKTLSFVSEKTKHCWPCIRARKGLAPQHGKSLQVPKSRRKPAQIGAKAEWVAKDIWSRGDADAGT